MDLAQLPRGHSYGHIQATTGAAIHCGDVVDLSVHHHHHHHVSDGRLIESPTKSSLYKLQPSEISDYDAAATLAKLLKWRLPGTCTWLLDKSLFRDWKSGKVSPILYITGTVGSGKTILAASTITQLNNPDLGPKRTTIHFFVGEATGSESGLVRLLRALIRQLWDFVINQPIEVGSVLAAMMKSEFHQRKAAIPSSELGDILMQLLDKFGPVTIIIDAVDRLLEDDVAKFLGLMQTLSTRCEKGVQMLCFCRDVLGRGIRRVSDLPRSRHITIELSDVQNDISRFVDHEIGHLQSVRPVTQNLRLIDEVKSALKDNSNKMFLWIYFQMHNIWSPDFTTCDEDIRKQLQDLPDGLEQTYVRCLERIEQNNKGRSQDIALKAFKWVSSVKLPASSRQLREAVSIDPQSLPLRVDRVINFPVTDYCANLLVIHPAADAVTFAHHSVQTFLQDKEKLPEHLQKFHLDAEADDAWCGEICIAYCRHLLSMRQLSLRNRSSMPISMKGLLTTEFSASGVGKLLDKSAQLLGRKISHDVVLPISTQYLGVPQELDFHHYLRIGWLIHSRTIHRSPAAFAQFKKLCLSTDPIIHPWLKVNKSAREHHQRLLEHAAAHDHIPLFLTVTEDIERSKNKASLARLLREVSPDAKQTLLHLAAIRGSLNMVRKLLEYVDVNVRDQDGVNVVARAMQAHQNDVAAYLLEHSKADESHAQVFEMIPPSRQASNSLIAVCASAGYLDGIKLVQRFRPWSPPNHWCEALFAACWYGHQDVARYIIETEGTNPFEMPCISLAIRAPVRRDTFNFAIERNYFYLATMILKIGGRFTPTQVSQNLLRRILGLLPQDSFRLLEMLFKAGLKVPITSADMENLISTSTTRSIYRSQPLLQGLGVRFPATRLNQIFANRMAVLLLRKLYQGRVPDFGSFAHVEYTSADLEWWLRYGSDDLLLYMMESFWLCEAMTKRLRESQRELKMAPSLQLFAKRKSLRLLHALVKSKAFHSVLLPKTVPKRWSTLWLLFEAFATVENLHLAYTADFDDTVNPWFRQTDDASRQAQANTVVYAVRELRRMPFVGTLRINWLQLRPPPSLLDVPDFKDYSLNFPFGYEELNDGSWCIRGYIKVSVYLWNWRLNRKRRKPYSMADMELMRLLFDHYLAFVRSRSQVTPLQHRNVRLSTWNLPGQIG